MTANTSATGGFLPGVGTSPAGDDILEDAVHDWLAALSGLPGNLVRPSLQARPPKQPEVGDPWVAFQIGTRIADNNAVFQQDDESAQLTRQYGLTALVSVYGTDGGDRAQAILDAAQVAQNNEPLATILLKFARAGTITLTGDLLHSQWVRRWDFEVQFHLKVRREYSTLRFFSVNGPDVIN